MRVSFSILNAWYKRDYERAIAPFLGIQIEPNDAMIRGINLHEEWEAETLKTGNRPKAFGGGKLVNPRVENQTKKVVKINDWLELSGVLDLNYGELLEVAEDYKSSTQEATAHANSWQHKVYKVLYPQLEKFIYRVQNPHTGEVTVALIHLTDQTMVDALEWIITQASELKHYLEMNNYPTERKSREELKRG